MSYWDGTRIVQYPPVLTKHWPGWATVDCGCCNGLQWGGEQARECVDCVGNGTMFLHLKSVVLAQWPGGPLRGGKAGPRELEKIRVQLK